MTAKEDISSLKPGPIKWMASHPVAGNLLMLIFLLGGLLLFTQTTKEVFPEFSLDIININVVYPGASPAEVEQSIILAIENALSDVDGIKTVTAQANQGVASIQAEVVEGEDTIRLLQDVNNAVDQILTLPEEAEKPQVSMVTRSRGVMELAVYGDVPPNVLRQATETIKDQLQRHSDIGPVELVGARDFEIHVEVSQDNLRRYNLTLSDIANRIRQVALELGGGSLKTERGEILVRLDERRDVAKDFATIPIITQANGAKVYLKDIAEIKEGFEDTDVSASFNEKPAILLQVFRIGTQTPTSVTEAVKSIIPELKATLPDAISIGIVNDRSIIFKQRAQLLLKNGLLGLALVILLLAIFLDMRLAFWVSMGIPISILGAFLTFPLSGVTINIISMFAFIISLGIVVDDAVVMGENIYRCRQLGQGPIAAAVNGARQISIPIFTSVSTNMVAFLPLFFVPGFAGKIFSVIPSVVIATFFISLVESLFILPMHLTYKKSTTIKNRLIYHYVRQQKRFNRRFSHFINHSFKRWLEWLMINSTMTSAVFFAALLVVMGYIISGRMGLEVFPKLESDFAYAAASLPKGTHISRIKAIEAQFMRAANEVIANNGSEKIATGTFTSIKDSQIEARVFLTDPDDRPISTSEFTKQWRQTTGPLAGVETSSFEADRGGPGSGAILSVELSHRDVSVLEKSAQDLAAELAQYRNTKDIDDGSAQGKIQYDFKLKPLAFTVGLTSRAIAQQVRAAFYGVQALRQQRGAHEITVLVRWPEHQRQSEYHLNNLILKTPVGGEVLLKDVATVEKGRAYTTINRSDGYRVAVVKSDVEPRADAIKLINSLKQDFLPRLTQRYPGLSYSFTGAQDDLRESITVLLYGLAAVIFIMYAMLAVLLSSYFQPLMILIAIPFSGIGAVGGHLIMGYSLSMMSLFGMMALAGVVVNDSLMLVYFTNENRREGLSVHDAVIKACTQRFRPIILTTMTTFVGLSPMILETSRQARFLIPMAISLAFGILFATFVTLILVPCLYTIIHDITEFYHRFRDGTSSSA